MVLEGMGRRLVGLAGDGIPMTHQLGKGVIHLPFGLRLTDQPPERLYTYFRNQIVMLRLPYVPRLGAPIHRVAPGSLLHLRR